MIRLKKLGHVQLRVADLELPVPFELYSTQRMKP